MVAPEQRRPSLQERSSPQEVVLQLEAEIRRLRSALDSKDRRIAELSRPDAKETRTKRDLRLLAGELRDAKRRFADESRRWQEERSQLHDALAQLQVGGKLQAQTPVGAGGFADAGGPPQAVATTMHPHGTTMAATPAAAEGRPHTPTAATSQASPQAAASAVAAGAVPAAVAVAPAVEELVRPVLYSTFHEEHAATVGRQELLGVGIVEGAASVAKVLLQRVNGSVYERQAVAQGLAQQPRFAGGFVLQGAAPQQQPGAAGLGGVAVPGMAAAPRQQQQQLAAVMGMPHM